MQDSSQPKTVRVDLNIWYDEKDGHIHLASPGGGFITTVCDEPESKRRHTNLFWKLAACLKEAGAPHPIVPGE